MDNNYDMLVAESLRVKTSSEEDFWYRVLNILQTALPATKRLTPKERTILIYVLSHPENTSPFIEEGRKDLCNDLGFTTHGLSWHLGNLRKKEWINEYSVEPFLLEIRDTKQGLNYALTISFHG